VIQQVAEAEAKRVKDEWNARGTTVVVLEPSSGRLLGVSNEALAATNRIAASTFKPLVVAAALEEGVIRVDDRFDCGHGRRIYDGGAVLRDAGSFGELSVTEILARSSNIGMSKIFDRLGGPKLERWFDVFHLNQPSPLAGSSSGSLHHLDEPSAGTMRGAVTAIGFGAWVSAVRLAAAYGAFANAGVYTDPTSSRRSTPTRTRVLAPGTARAVLAMLETAVDSGTGQAARVDGVRIAGKTGTADLELPGGEPHSAAYFVGIVPADAPRFVIVVMVEDPKGGAGGGRVAAPVFARVASRIL
jgi:cell division protein FtsI (penicillin-binding protein 3)